METSRLTIQPHRGVGINSRTASLDTAVAVSPPERLRVRAREESIMPHASEKLVPAAPARWRQWGMTLLWTTPVLFLILALLYGVLTRPPTDSDHSAPRLGQSLADFTLPDLQGRLVQLAALRGKVVFINVWATWCPPPVSRK